MLELHVDVGRAVLRTVQVAAGDDGRDLPGAAARRDELPAEAEAAHVVRAAGVGLPDLDARAVDRDAARREDLAREQERRARVARSRERRAVRRAGQEERPLDVVLG